MANINIPPAASGIRGPKRGLRQPIVKLRNLKGSLVRLWKITKGSRKGLGWILALSAQASASAILSPLVIGRAVNMVDTGHPVMTILLILTGLYLCDWLVRFLQQFLMASVGQKMIHHIRTTLFAARPITRGERMS